MPSYREEREAVARVRTLRQSHDLEQRKQALERDDEQQRGHQQVAVPQQLPPIGATYGDIMQLLGPTNYPAMLELFRGTTGLPDGVHPEVTVSFELFEAIQKRLVSTRDELESSKKELFLKAQQLSCVQNELSRIAERNAALARELKQSEDMCLELRKYTSDVSIMKQQHENEVIAFKDEIAGMVSRLNFSEKQITDAHHKLSESMVQMAQKDAVIASLKRSSKQNSSTNANPPSASGDAAIDESGDDSVVQSSRRFGQPADRIFQEQLKQHITQLEKEKRLLESEVRDVLDMHEGYRNHVENIVRQYEDQFMFYEDAIASHTCSDDFSLSRQRESIDSSDCAIPDGADDTWDLASKRPLTEIPDLLRLCERGVSVMEALNDPSEDSTFKLQVTRCKDGAVEILRGSVEAIRLMEKLSTHMSTVVSIGELRDTWRRVQTRWVDHIRRLVGSGVTALQFGLDSIQDRERAYRGDATKEIEEKWVRVINTQYRLIMPMKTSDSQTEGPPGCRHEAIQVGAGFFVDRVTVMASTAPQAATANRSSQTESSGTPSTTSLKGSLSSPKIADPASHQFELDQGSVLPAKVTAVHNAVLQLAKVIRKLHFSNPPAPPSSPLGSLLSGALVDPLHYMKQLSQALQPKWLDEVLSLDVLLLKASLAMTSEQGDVSTWLHAYQCQAELHRLERTIETVGGLPPGRSLDTSVRADVANYPTLHKQLEDAAKAFTSQLDEGSLQKSTRVILASDKSAYVMSQAAAKAQQQKLQEAEAFGARPFSRGHTNSPSKRSPPPPSNAVTSSKRNDKDSKELSTSDVSLKVITAGDASTRTQPSRASRGGESSSAPDEWSQCDEIGGEFEVTSGHVNAAGTIMIPTLSTPTTTTRRTPFKRTVEDDLVEHARSTSPATHLPSLQAKMEEAMSFGGDASRRGRGKDDEPMWSSSNASGQRPQSPSTTQAHHTEKTKPKSKEIPKESTAGVTTKEVHQARDNHSVGTAAAQLELTGKERKGPTAGKPRPPPHDRKGSTTVSRAEAAIQQQYERDRRELPSEGPPGPHQSLASSMVMSSSPLNNAAKASSPTATQQQQPQRPVLQVPTRNSDGKFNAVDSAFFFVAPPDDSIQPVATSVSASTATSPRSAAPNAANNNNVSEKHRSTTPEFELIGMSRKETVAPSAMAASRKGDNRSSLDDDDEARSASPKKQVTSPTAGPSSSQASPRFSVVSQANRRQTSPPHNAGGPTAAQIIEQARQQLKKNMQSDGPLSLGPSLITSVRPTPSSTTLAPQGKRPGGGQPSQHDADVEEANIQGRGRVVSPPVTAPAQARRRQTSQGGVLSPPSHSLPDLSAQQPHHAGHSMSHQRSPQKPLATIGVPVGASPTPFWSSSTPEVTESSPPPQAWFPPYVSRDAEEEIEGVVGCSPRKNDGETSPSNSTTTKRPRTVGADADPSHIGEVDDDVSPGFGRPIANPRGSIVPVGNPDTTVYQQRVHGLVPRRPNGADVMMDMVRKQRDRDAVDPSSVSLGVSGSGVHQQLPILPVVGSPGGPGSGGGAEDSSPFGGTSPPYQANASSRRDKVSAAISRRRESSSVVVPPPDQGPNSVSASQRRVSQAGVGGAVVVDDEVRKLLNGSGSRPPLARGAK